MQHYNIYLISLQKRMEMPDRWHLVATITCINALQSYTTLRHATRRIRSPAPDKGTLPVGSFVLMRPSLPFHGHPAALSASFSMAIWAIRCSVPTKGSIAAVTAIVIYL